ncbi:hypothetical protein [Spirillospora sp. CA-294931]|uniref:hypothetical protein n=1 Tax=Spirillospora sp. CA-294931 TaxID=3240042 RepID=UPI003D923527
MSVPGYQSYSPPAPPERKGMAVASIVLGLVGLPALVLCGAGLALALAGLIIGIVAAVRGNGRGLAFAGIGCSLVTLAVGAAAAVWLLTKAAECGDEGRYPDESSRQRCVEREFPFTGRVGSPPG